MQIIDSEKYYYRIDLRSAVLIPVIETPEGRQILFEVRADLPKQPGDICFPGGKREPDESPEQTVIREACEELLITPDQVRLTARMSPFRSGNLEIVPFVGNLIDYKGTYDAGETKEVFTVPVTWFSENSPRECSLDWKPGKSDTFPYDKIVNGENYRWRTDLHQYYFYEYEGHVIWGFTANILRAWLQSDFTEMNDHLTVYKPECSDLWFKQLMMSDEETMSYNHAWGGTIPFPEDRWHDWYDRWIIHPEGKRYYRYLKDEAGQFIGEIAWHYDDSISGYLTDVVIYAKYRGKGYGTTALSMLCSAAKDQGISVLYDDIAVDNPAIGLFRKHGFTEEYRTDDVVMMKKEL